MATRLIQRHRTEFVHRAYKLHFLCPVQIDESEHLELAERQHGSDHILIFGTGRRLLLGRAAERIYCSGSIEWFIEQFTVGGDDERFKTLDRNAVTGLHDRSFACRRSAEVIKPLLIDRLNVVAAAVKLAKRNHL